MSEKSHKANHNINDRITFRLTEAGREILAAKFASEIEAVPEGVFAEEVREDMSVVAQQAVDADGTVTMPIWEMASVFGDHMYNGGPQVIADNSFQFTKSS